jgi:VanZ family protein
MSPFVAWLPALCWSGLIWMLGTDGFSAPETSRILDPLLAWLFPGLDAVDRTFWVGLIRKTAHPSEYGILALLSLYGVRHMAPRPTPHALALALLPAALVASADELRQSLSAVRTGAAFDVGLDLTGAALALGLALLAERALGRRLIARRATEGPLPSPPV